MLVSQLFHVAIKTADLDTTVGFYTGLLGLVQCRRPSFDFQGAWLAPAVAGAEAILHVYAGDAARAADGRFQTGTAVIDHLSLNAHGYRELRERLRELGLPYRENVVPGLPFWQLFVYDPNGVMLELTYHADAEGGDPRAISRVWDELYNGTRGHYALARGHVFPIIGRRGLNVSAMSGIDIALWDLLGKSLGVPVHQLLGGKRADRMPAYASGGWKPAQDVGEELNGYLARGGFRAVKMRVGVQDGTPSVSAARVRAARAALAPEVDLMCDAHGTWTVSEARQFCRMVEDCNVAWLEEPVTADDALGLAEVRRSTSIPIAAGESEFTRHDFLRLVEARAVDIVQPDLAICGGISEAQRIAAVASAANLRLAAHLWAGAPAFAAGLHLSAANPAAFILEYSVGANPMIHDLIEESFPVKDGMLEIPDRPGLGITPRADFIARHAVG